MSTSLARAIAPLLLLVLPSCITEEVATPQTGTLLPSVRAQESTPEDARPFTGLRLESRVSGSLMELDFAPGLEVTAVIPGSPAESVGIRVGDRVVKVDGKVIESPDQFDALLAVGRRLVVEVERDSGVARVDLEPRRRDATVVWQPQYHAERLKARFAARTVEYAPGEFGCEVVEIERTSPLLETKIRVGDVIVSLDGERATDARRMLEAIAARPFGAEISLGLRRGASVDEVAVELFSPPRHLTGVGLPLLFRFRRDLGKDETHFSLVDLWLFSIYSWSREGATRRHELLGFTLWESGVGEIADDGENPADAADDTESRE